MMLTRIEILEPEIVALDSFFRKSLLGILVFLEALRGYLRGDRFFLALRHHWIQNRTCEAAPARQKSPTQCHGLRLIASV